MDDYLGTTYRFRIYPNVAQQEKIEKNFGACRFVYNFFLDERIKAYQNQEQSPSREMQKIEMTAMKQQRPWLCDAESTSLQIVLDRLDFAYKRYFKWKKQGLKVGLPQRKRKHEFQQSYTSRCIDSGIRIIDNKHVRLPKLGSVRCAVSKVVDGIIREATVTKSGSGKYYVCIRCKIDPVEIKKTGKKIGLAIRNDGLIADSDGNSFSFRSISYAEQAFDRFKNSLSRKPSGSKNWQKRLKEFSAFFEKKQNQMMDDLNKITTQLIKNYDVLYFPASLLEVDHAGRLIRMLDYKAKRYGKKLEIVYNDSVDSTIYQAAKEVLQKGLQIA